MKTITQAQKMYAAQIALNEALQYLTGSEGKAIQAVLDLQNAHARMLLPHSVNEMNLPAKACLCVVDLATSTKFPTVEDIYAVMGIAVEPPPLAPSAKDAEKFLRRGMVATKCEGEPLTDALVDWLTVRSRRNPIKLAGRTVKDVIRWLTAPTVNKLLSMAATEIGEAAADSGYRDLYLSWLRHEMEINDSGGYAHRAQCRSVFITDEHYDTYKAGKMPHHTLAHFAKRAVARAVVADIFQICHAS